MPKKRCLLVIADPPDLDNGKKNYFGELSFYQAYVFLDVRGIKRSLEKECRGQEEVKVVQDCSYNFN